MDLITALKSKKARNTSWKSIYENIVSKMNLNGPKIKSDHKNNDTTINWFDHCMNVMVKKKILPTLINSKGTTFNFTFPLLEKKFVETFMENYIRMIVIATLYNITCEQSQKLYVSNYDHDTDIVTAYPIEELLMAAFYGVKMTGILFVGFLNKIITSNNHDETITDQEAINKVFKEIDYSELFGMPHNKKIEAREILEKQVGRKHGYYEHLHSESCYDSNKMAKITREVDKIYKSDDSKEEDNGIDIDKLVYYPCCVYYKNYTGHVIEECSKLVLKESHPCFGDCGADYVKRENKKNIPIHSQMFDFNKFIIKIEKIDKNKHKYQVEFDENQNQPYKHASYVDMGRGNVIGSVSESFSKATGTTSMKISIAEDAKIYKVIVNYVGIDWF